MADERATYEIRLKDNFSRGFSKIDKSVNKFEGSLGRVQKKRGSGLSGMAGGLGAITRAAGALGIAVGAAGLIKTVAGLGIEMEQTRVSFTTFLGSAEKANKVIGELNQFSNVTPFDNAQVIKAGKGLLAFGVAQDKLIPSLKTIGDISAGTGKDFNELSTIYGKARVAGTLYAEDINQLVEAGVPIMGEFAKALGTTEDQVKKMASQGKLKFKDLETAFKNLTGEGGMFFNLMEKQSQTVAGRFSTLQGKLQTIGIKLGENLLPVLGKSVDFLLEIVEIIPKLDFSSMVSAFDSLDSSLSRIGTAFSALFDAIGFNISKMSAFQIVVDSVAVALHLSYLPLVALIEGVLLLKDVALNTIDVFKGFGDVLIGALTFDPAQITRGIETVGEATISGVDKVTKRFSDFAKGEADFFRGLGGEESSGAATVPEAGLFTTPPGATSTTGATKEQGKKKKVSSNIQGSAPKNITLNITKLIETLNMNNQTFKQNNMQMVEEVKRALLTGLNDVVIAQK